jgi:hypothetical protein
MRFALAGLLALALAACADGDQIAPTLPPTDEPSGALAEAPLRDALERIVPTLAQSSTTEVLRSALTTALEQGNPAALSAAASALQVLEVEQPDAAVEADVIRLAITAQL